MCVCELDIRCSETTTFAFHRPQLLQTRHQGYLARGKTHGPIVLNNNNNNKGQTQKGKSVEKLIKYCSKIIVASLRFISSSKIPFSNGHKMHILATKCKVIPMIPSYKESLQKLKLCYCCVLLITSNRFLLDPFYRRGPVYKRKFCLSVCVSVCLCVCLSVCP